MNKFSRPRATGAEAAPDPGGRDDSFPAMARYRRDYRDVSYYSAGRTWSDYAPAYRYGYRQQAAHAKTSVAFEQVEPALERGWTEARGASRLNWTEARPAVMAAWRDAAALASGVAIDERLFRAD